MSEHIKRHPFLFAASLSAILILGVAFWLGSGLFARRASARNALFPIDARSVESALVRTGLTPANLACVGASSSDAAQVVAAMENHLAQHEAVLASADAAVAAARADRDRLSRRAQSGLASVEEVQELAAARQSLASALATRDAELGAAFDAATAGLQTAQRSALSKLRANAAWSVPTEFGTGSRTDEAWAALREALAVERINTASGEQVPQSVADLLSAERGQAAVSTASANLATYLAEVSTSWAGAIDGME